MIRAGAGGVLAVLVATASLWLPAATARVDGGGSCSLDGVCSVSDTDPRIPPKKSGESKAKDEDKLPDLPECGSFADAYTDIPLDGVGMCPVREAEPWSAGLSHLPVSGRRRRSGPVHPNLSLRTSG